MLTPHHIAEFTGARSLCAALMRIEDVSATNPPAKNVSPLHNYARQAIAASAALTSASIAGAQIGNAHYAYLDHAAYEARQHLLACLERDHEIDATMAEQLGALL